MGVSDSKLEWILHKVIGWKDDDSLWSFAKRKFKNFFKHGDSPVASLIILCIIAIPIFAIGVAFLDDCPVDKKIPIFLLVGGFFGIIKCIRLLGTIVYTKCCGTADTVVTICVSCCKYWCDDGESDDKKKTDWMSVVIYCFLVIWFFAGSHWVFRIYGDVEYKDAGSANYCHEGCYKFAFGVLILSYTLMLLVLVCFCCGCCIGVYSLKKK